MDLSKAFDTLDHSILLRKLAHYGLGPLSCKLIDSYLSHREQYVQLENAASSRLPISTGVPQGSVLGPILFLIYLNDIENVCPLLDTICYADDTTLLFNFEKLNLMKSINHVISNFVNEQLEKIHVWMMTNKLSLNIKKTKYMIFRKNTKTSREYDLDIQINSIKLERPFVFNFLGLFITPNLDWKHRGVAT